VVLPGEIRPREGRAWLAGWQGTRGVLRWLPAPAPAAAADLTEDVTWLHGFLARLAGAGAIGRSAGPLTGYPILLPTAHAGRRGVAAQPTCWWPLGWPIPWSCPAGCPWPDGWPPAVRWS
jgi:hypothetical protein